MTPSLSRYGTAVLAAAILIGCGGGDGGTPPATVANVAITVPAAAPTLQTIGRTVQLTAVATTSGGAVVPGTVFTFNSSNTGVATVNGSGLVTAVANGTTTIIATALGIPSPAKTVTVAQAVGNVLVTSTVAAPDTLFAATRTRQFTALARDSNNNTVAGAPAIAWASSSGATATVSAAGGLVTAVADGSANITATSGTVVGTRPVIVRRLVANKTITPPTPTITTVAGTQVISGTASDSANVAIPMSWVSRTLGVATVSPANGTSTTATAVTNGTSRIVFTVPAVLTGVDSVTLTVSNQPAAGVPTTAAVQVIDNIFRSSRNLTQNAAIDTVAIGGTVTWTWGGANPHGVASTGAPSFTSQAGTLITGTLQRTFATAGTYTYECSVHGPPMTGTIVVR